jgi:hypothetical protein
MSRIQIIAIATALTLGVTASANAANVFVQNASFEAPALPGGTYQGDPTGLYGTYGNTRPDGWVSTSGFTGAQNFGNDSYFKPADGAQAVYINAGGIFQDLGALAPDTLYTLTVAAGNQPLFGVPSTGSISFYTSSGVLSSTVVTPLLVGSMSDFSTSFKTGSAVTGNLFVGLNLTNGQQVLFDNVRVTSAVPEPATWAMMLLGFGLVGFGIRSSRKQTVRLTYA